MGCRCFSRVTAELGTPAHLALQGWGQGIPLTTSRALSLHCLSAWLASLAPRTTSALFGLLHKPSFNEAKVAQERRTLV